MNKELINKLKSNFFFRNMFNSTFSLFTVLVFIIFVFNLGTNSLFKFNESKETVKISFSSELENAQLNKDVFEKIIAIFPDFSAIKRFSEIEYQTYSYSDIIARIDKINLEDDSLNIEDILTVSEIFHSKSNTWLDIFLLAIIVSLSFVVFYNFFLVRINKSIDLQTTFKISSFLLLSCLATFVLGLFFLNFLGNFYTIKFIDFVFLNASVLFVLSIISISSLKVITDEKFDFREFLKLLSTNLNLIYKESILILIGFITLFFSAVSPKLISSSVVMLFSILSAFFATKFVITIYLSHFKSLRFPKFRQSRKIHPAKDVTDLKTKNIKKKDKKSKNKKRK